MKIIHYTGIPARKVAIEGATGTAIRWLIAPTDNPPHFVMRMFEIEPGGHTPLHAHADEHEVFVLEGEGSVVLGEQVKPFTAGFAIYVPPELKHQFNNTGNGLLRFLCLIPKS